MKKTFKLALAVCMSACMAFPALALPSTAEGPQASDGVTIDSDADFSSSLGNGSEENKGGAAVIDADSKDYQTSISVSGQYEETHKADTVVSVDVKWDSMNFTYAGRSDGVWNPVTHQYDGVSEEAGWVKDSAKITCVNHSNTNLMAKLSFDAESDTASGSFDKSYLALKTAVGTEYAEAPEETATFTVSGSLSGNETIGTITVELSDTMYVTSVDVLRDALKNGGVVTLCGATGLGDDDATYQNAVSAETVINLNDYTLTVDEINVLSGASLTVNGDGTVHSASTRNAGLVIADGGTLIINGGTYTGYMRTTVCSNSTIIINGGDFSTAYHGNFLWKYNESISGYTIRIQGGTFPDIGSGLYYLGWKDYVDTDSYEIVDNGNDTCTVVPK